MKNKAKSKNKMNNKPLVIMLLLVMVFVFIAAISGDDSEGNSEPVTSEVINADEINNKDEEKSTPNYLDLKTADEVKKAYDENIEKIMDKEKIENAKQVTFEDLLKRSEKAQEIALTIEGATNKINTVTNLVALDFIVSDIEEEVLDEVLQYIISEYKNNTLLNNETLEKNLYLARVLDKSLNQNQDKIKEANISFDFFKILRESIRLNDENYKEELKEDSKFYFEENKRQIERDIDLFN